MLQDSVFIPDIIEAVVKGYNNASGEVAYSGIKSQGNILSFTDNADGSYTVACDSVDGLSNNTWISIDSESGEFDKNLGYKGEFGNPGFRIFNLDAGNLTYDIYQTKGFATTTGSWVKNKVYYDFGTIKELNQRILDRKSPSFNDQIFPLIYLPMDVEENMGGWTKVSTVNNLTIFIINLSEHERSPEKLENNFKPILYPIYESFINGIADSNIFDERNTEDIEYTKWDRYYWSSDEQTTSLIGEHIDGIELNFKELNIKNNVLKCITT